MPNSEIGIASEITRIKTEERVYKFSSDALTGPKSVWKILGDVLSKLQDFCNQMNARAAALEARPVIDTGVSATAGVSQGYAVVTISGQKYKIELRAIQ